MEKLMSYVDKTFITNFGAEFIVIEEVSLDIDKGPIYLCVSSENKTFNITENDLDILLSDGAIQEVTTDAELL
jgi:hypothetical protein